MRIIIWSGPRNLSTAMMRAFGARADTHVVDEPFYAAYLAATDLNHPMRDEIVSSGETDWREVAVACAAEAPKDTIRYEKHMTHHMIDGAPLDWMKGAKIAFLIRDPAQVAASYAAKRDTITLEDIGVVRQSELFDYCSGQLGQVPPVIEAADIRRAPGLALRSLCEALGINFDPAMLSWPSGPRQTDGVWGRHWYASVNQSTGFVAPDAQPRELPDHIQDIVDEARPYHDRLARLALKV